VLLSVFLLLVFWRLHRSGAIQGGGRFMVLALISGALASALGGVKLVSDAVAAIQISPIFLDMTEEAGGSLVLFESNHSACVRNNTSVRQKILSMEYVYPQGVDVTSSPEETCLLDDGASPAYPGCQVGQELQTGEVCGITADANLPL